MRLRFFEQTLRALGTDAKLLDLLDQPLGIAAAGCGLIDEILEILPLPPERFSDPLQLIHF